MFEIIVAVFLLEFLSVSVKSVRNLCLEFGWALKVALTLAIFSFFKWVRDMFDI